MFPSLVGTVIIAGIVGYLSERWGITRNGILASIVSAVGGAFVFYFVWVMFGFGFRHPGWNAIVAALGALVLVPTRWRR